MDNISDPDFFGRAIALGRSSAGVPSDLAALLFPKSDVSISDRMLSNSRQYLYKIIADIEADICRIAIEHGAAGNEALNAIAENARPNSYPLLKKAGLFDDAEILNHIFVTAQYNELQARLLQKTSQEDLESALTRNLDHLDNDVAEAAMALLVAQNRTGGSGAADIAGLPVEILYVLIWPVVAAIEKISANKGSALVQAADRLLAEHDESQSVGSRAMRLAHCLDRQDQQGVQYPHPFTDGLDLCLARLSNRTGLLVEQLILFTAETNMARFIIVMRALNFPADQALSLFTALDGANSLLTKASYNEIAIEDAQSLVEKWSTNKAYQDASHRIASVDEDVR